MVFSDFVRFLGGPFSKLGVSYERGGEKSQTNTYAHISGKQTNYLHAGGKQTNYPHIGGSQITCLHVGGNQTIYLHIGGNQTLYTCPDVETTSKDDLNPG